MACALSSVRIPVVPVRLRSALAVAHLIIFALSPALLMGFSCSFSIAGGIAGALCCWCARPAPLAIIALLDHALQISDPLLQLLILSLDLFKLSPM